MIALPARPDVDAYFSAMAALVAARSTCVRRAVGCVLVDSSNRVLSTGYNGVPRGAIHCVNSPCPGAKLTSGTGLDECLAIHAETNAIAMCSDIRAIATAYCTTRPCISCTKQLLNTSCSRIVYLREYPGWSTFKQLWALPRTCDAIPGIDVLAALGVAIDLAESK